MRAARKVSSEAGMDGIRSLLKESLPRSLRGLRDEDRLAAAWVIVCGTALANHSRIMRYDDGQIHVEVRDKVWLEQMRSMSAQLGSELSRTAGIKVTELHFVMKRNFTNDE
jgi:predicted nucleic acid-binding Zn ribbon protein